LSTACYRFTNEFNNCFAFNASSYY